MIRTYFLEKSKKKCGEQGSVTLSSQVPAVLKNRDLMWGGKAPGPLCRAAGEGRSFSLGPRSWPAPVPSRPAVG